MGLFFGHNRMGSAPVQTAKYYVDTAGVNSAERDGSALEPFLTIAYAITRVDTEYSDIIHVNSGTYSITSQIIVPENINIEGDGIDQTILTSTIATSSTPVLRYISSAEGTSGNQSITNLTLDGLNTALIPLWIWGRSNVEVYNCKFKDFFQRGVAFSGKLSFGDGAPSIYATGNKFHDCIIDNCARYTTSYQGNLNISGQEDMLVYNNTIIANSLPANTNGVGIKMTNSRGWTKGCKIYNNTITTEIREGGWNFGMELWNSWGLEVYNNTVYGTIDIAGEFQEKGDYEYGMSIHHNFIGRTEPDIYRHTGILLEALDHMSDVHVYKNKIMNVNLGIVLYVVGNSYSNVFIQYNLIYLAHIYNGYHATYGIRVNEDGANCDITNWYIQNNTIVGGTVPGVNYRVSAGVRLRSPDVGTMENMYIDNNIFEAIDTTPWHVEGATAINSMYTRNNVYHIGSSVPIINTPITLHVNTDNSTNDPVFVENEVDFRLQETSSLINAGIDVGLTSDINGNNIVGLPDIGAYEYV